MKYRLKGLSSGLLVGALSLGLAHPAHAMLPVIDFAALAQLGNQLAELRVQTQTIQQTVQTLSGDQYQWGNNQLLINQLGSALENTHGLAYSASRWDEQFKQAYPGYVAPAQWNQQYQANVNTAQHTFAGTLHSLGLSAQHFATETNRLVFLQHQVQHAQGQTQAIQASAQMSSEIATQLQLLRQTTMAQTNAQTAYYATQVQDEASRRAQCAAIVKAGATTMPPYGTSGYALTLPAF